jgi:hypothetical protein
MYFASSWPNSLPQNSRLGIWKWAENSTSLTSWDKTITAWTFTDRGDAHCGSPNWLGRVDQRALAGARYVIHATNLDIPGRTILGWWWTVGEGGSFPFPYIEAAAFYEDTMTQVAGNQGRPLVWTPAACFAYPSVAANKSTDLGIVFNYATSSNSRRPDVAYALADDYIHAPPGWLFFNLENSNALPSDNRWGDYNTIREFDPSHGVWAAGAHYIPGNTNCANCSDPVYFVFGRERDEESLAVWGGTPSLVTWTDSFTNGVAATLAQCQKWHDFLDELTPDKPFSSVTMSGTFDPTGITITNDAATQQLANLLRTRTAGSVTSGGHTWYVSTGCDTPASCPEASPAVELRVDFANSCQCPDPAYIVRPDIGNANWGGVNADTCGGPSQTMTVEFN